MILVKSFLWLCIAAGFSIRVILGPYRIAWAIATVAALIIATDLLFNGGHFVLMLLPM